MNLEKLSKLLPAARVLNRPSFLAMVLILLSSLALWDTSYAAGQVFYDGFEDGSTNKWLQDDYRNRCTVVTSAADGIKGPDSGSRMARCNWNGTVAINGPTAYESLKIGSVPYTNEIFYRFRLRIDKNVERTDGSPLKMLRIFYWTGDQATYRDMFADSVLGNSLSNRGNVGATTLPTYWGGASGDNSGSSDSWHTVEYYFNHTTGQIKVWHDNVLIRSNSVSMGSQKWLPFYLTSNYADSHDATNYVYFDNIEIYSDAGTGATGLMSDGTISNTSSSTSSSGTTTLPPAPTNLVVVQ
ncbi:MAG: hypothetical protein JSR29_21380 [Nitrospira sp.]|nr:hypothetical protein [Nitrospira sp.]